MKNVLYMSGAIVNAGDFQDELFKQSFRSLFYHDIKLTTEIRVNKEVFT